ncbi:MAG TPA: endopeptidase La [Candidatus Hydrogenedentes bacterium]|jgi:ATP-dependent Lon protease|nr:endopeptidase La [Candidatus Hydrogenedentota bacterium]MDY0031641.1 endopeptidase La [FCB group bacterium]NLT59285.1 endopeptidase La [Candidatus Hydrogenedentota bacterium]HNV21452.1 endopeptidase La [Candidatus Hydrogenedentota bacterium]HNZ20115.1 endopeptidase La [Candidatus Hydrogenedentota bacterium]
MARKKRENTDRLPLLPLKDVVVFPQMVLPLLVGRPASMAAVEESLSSGRPLFLCSQVDPDVESPGIADLHAVGVAGNILQTLRMPDSTMKVVIEGMARGRVLALTRKAGYVEVEVERVEVDEVEADEETMARMRMTLRQFEDYAHASQRVSPEVVGSLQGIPHPAALADLICAYLPLSAAERQELLEELDPAMRLEHISSLLMRENDLMDIERRVRDRVRDQMERSQREYYLHEQLKAIHQELGTRDEGSDEFADLRKQIDKAHMPKEVRQKALREYNRFERMPSMSPESGVIRTYLEWLVDVPWSKHSRDVIDLEEARKVLDEDHYGLVKVKERILEFLAVRKLNKKSKGPILCLVGPPGVGKTSLGKSIARAMKRKFVRVSLGGIRDEAEIRGHRRTYVGALPGRIIQGLVRGGVRNPVFMLDEIDKMSMDFRGDPSSALLEVLDPEQNHAFSDHYLEVDVDLQEVFFITTANDEYEIPAPLHDRMEVVRLSGYTSFEKERIAQYFLVPKQMEECGLSEEVLAFAPKGIQKIIQGYTREAGVRELERQVANVCRKVAVRVVDKGCNRKMIINEKRVGELLGPPDYFDNRADTMPGVGVAVGLAWTAVGGDILHIETSLARGKGELALTGQLGEVMRESAQAAYTFLRAHASQLGVPVTFAKTYDVHVHVPEGAIPKDGPSAGIPIAVSLLSALKKKAPKPALAMTGEITLRGRVLPVGGVKEKVLAAHRAGIKTVVMPRENEKDLRDIPAEVKRELKFVLVERIDEAFAVAFGGQRKKK